MCTLHAPTVFYRGISYISTILYRVARGLAGTTGRWMRSSTSSTDEYRICSVCQLHSVEDEDHFVFECSVYRSLRTVEYLDLFVGHHKLRSFIWARQTSRGLLVTIRDCVWTRTHVRTLVS
jgi:hypothetical protein